VNGPNTAPLYQFLKASKPSFYGTRIKWNFTKFLVDKDGKVISRYGTVTKPLSIEVFNFFLCLSLGIISSLPSES
jgi:glutathione peroxidase